MRTFFALPVPEEAKKHIMETIKPFKDKNIDLKWVKPKGMHITLIFLGELDQRQADECARILREPGLKCKPFSVRYSGVGSFPPRGNPRVIFCRIKEGAEECREVYEYLKGFVDSSIYKEEREFHPHITLARVKGRAGDLNLDEIGNLEGVFTVDRCILYQSVLKPHGAEYREIASVRF